MRRKRKSEVSLPRKLGGAIAPGVGWPRDGPGMALLTAFKASEIVPL